MTARDDEALYAFRTNMVVTASAGTGKTFRLVTLYVLLTLGLSSKGQEDDTEPAPPVLPSRIAATTFSRAAAAEIRERVERVLRAVATASYDAGTEPYRAVLASRAERTRSDAITSSVMRERARVALAELPTALVDTLHGLAARVVRASALDLGMTPAYDVLDEDSARASVDAAVEEGLTDAIGRGDRAAADLLDAGGGLAMTRRRIGELLDRADEEGVRIDELAHTDFVESARQSLSRLRHLCEALASDESRPLAEPARVARAAIDRWVSSEPRPSERELADALELLFERRSPARPTPAEEEFFAFRAAVRGETNPARARRLAAFAARAAGLTPRAQAMGALLSDIARRRSVERRRTGALGFGDLLSLARDAVRDHAPLAEMARGMFDVLLVDEFQDTSRVQRDLVYLLRERPERALARAPGALPEASDLARSGLLLVGDRKQSIYGFRGADVTVFARVCAELAGRRASEALRLGAEFEVPEEPNASLISLVENRRSHPRILEFVNQFAEQDFDDRSPYPFDIRYAESEHLVPASKGGVDAPPQTDAARVVVVDDRNESPAELPPLVRNASGAIREALVAAGVVDRAVRGGDFGPLSFGDVAVLARRRSTLPLVEMALARLDIPYVVAGRGLFETREVRDVFALLRLMLDPYDRHALATILRGPGVGLADRSLAFLSDPDRGLTAPDEWFRSGTGLATRLADDEQERLRVFHARFADLRRVGLGLGPADAIRYATEKLDLDRVVAALPHAAQRLGNVERLVSIATTRGGSLTGFVRWLDRQIADQTDESEAAALESSGDAVTLMTIHASKGLEFKAVVLMDMGAAARAQPLTLALVPGHQGRPARLAVRHVHERGGSLYTPEAVELGKENTARELAERRRLTYVAMTRAKEHLFFLAPAAPANGSAAATLRRLLPELASGSGVSHGGLRVEGALSFLEREAKSPKEPARAVAALAPRVDRPPTDRGVLGIPTTALGLFEQCARRYRLVHELAVEPPPFRSHESSDHGRDDRRTLGTAAHRVLERWPLARFGAPTERAEVVRELAGEGFSSADPGALRVAGNIAAFLGGPHAKRIGAAEAVVYREEPFVLPVASEGGTLWLRGTIDLLVVLPDGSAEVLDYKSSWRPDLASFDFQLRAYALAARRRYGASRVRVGALNLAVAHEPGLVDLASSHLDEFESRLGNLRARFCLARSSGDFPGVDRARCESLRCGFVSACHGG